MIILGIDPGTATTGFGIIRVVGNSIKPVDYGIISTPPGVPMEQRLVMIYEQMNQIIEKWQPEQVAIEELFFNKKYNDRYHSGGRPEGYCCCLARKRDWLSANIRRWRSSRRWWAMAGLRKNRCSLWSKPFWACGKCLSPTTRQTRWPLPFAIPIIIRRK